MTCRSFPSNNCHTPLKRYGFAAFLCFLAGCTSDPPTSGLNIAQRPRTLDGAPLVIPPNLDAVPDAVPRHEIRTRAGNPDNYQVNGKHYVVLKESRDYVVRGVASWYGSKFHGLKTSNGEQYDMFAMSAAHKTLPIPCYARITNLHNGRAVTVRINDRGPFVDGRVIDLSYTAAYKLGILDKGTGYVEVRTVEPGQSLPRVYSAANSYRTEQRIRPLEDGDADEQLFVQVGAFSNPDNARKLQAELSELQLARLRVSPIASQKGWLYRVQLGPLADMAQANRLAGRLGERGITDTRFVIEKNNVNASMIQ
ncbi:MAG: septal ring lytic transglycosylase RlpA family protein [Gammaproteobacteria bacterium]